MSRDYTTTIPAPTLPAPRFRTFNATLAHQSSLVLQIMVTVAGGYLFLRWLCQPQEAWVIRYALILWASEILFFVLRQLVRELRTP